MVLICMLFDICTIL